MATVTKKLKPPESAGGDGIGLSITVSADQHDDDDTTTIFIPPSIPSPIPFEEEYDGEINNENTARSTTEAQQQPTHAISSIMREQSRLEQTAPAHQAVFPKKSDQAHVVALEDRVRDLEEKLSTLSMLLLQQNQRQQLSPRNDNYYYTNSNHHHQNQKSCSSSPDSSVCDSSISPPATPFRSLASFATIPSSNVPVLESPTPVSRRYRNTSGDFSQNSDNDHFGDFSLPYEQRSPRHFYNRNRGNNSNNNSSNLSNISQSLRSNLSYHILHAPNNELDLRISSSSCCNDAESSRDTGSENDSVLRNNNNNNKTIGNGANHDVGRLSNDDSFEHACRVPTLDSLPGSSRTSPIHSKDPIVAGVLSPDSLNVNDIDKGGGAVGCSPNDTKMPPAPFGGGKGGDNTIQQQERDVVSGNVVSGKDPSIKTVGISNSSSNIKINSNSNININSNSATNDGSEQGPKHKKKKSNIKSKWLDYLNSVQESNYDTDKQMEEFVKVPSAVEALLSFGFWISVDSFLYTLTMLPLRFVYSIFLLVVWCYTKIAGRKASGSFQFHRHNSYHLIQVSIIYIIYACVLKPIDISIMYHQIRNQSMVKLYLLVAMVEVFDRLMCSLGQDSLDSLYWNTTRRPRSSRLFVSALVVLVYTALHSFLLFVHVATLNVAMNSSDQALLSLLIGGNFAEIKSTVFKKYNKATLFKITASDICERFKLALFLFLVLMLNASQGMDQKMLYNYLSMCGIVVGSEWLSDWLKHSFITKFNYIASGVYSEYSLLLAGDVSGFGHEGENLDKSHAVVKRLGLAQIPLVCVTTKYLKEAYKYQTYEKRPQTWLLVVGIVSVWLLLLVTKLSLASLIERMSRNKLEAAPEFSKNNATVAKKKN